MSHVARKEVAQAELDALGLKHYLDVRATVRRMLTHMGKTERTAFAAAVAERLLREDERVPPREVKPYTLSWRPALDAVWRTLTGEAPGPRQIAAAVARFYVSPQFYESRHDDPADGEDHVVMACLYACECALHGCLEFAMWAGWRGFDGATLRAAADVEWPHRRPAEVSPYAWELAHPAIQAELDRQLADLELLAVEGAALDPSQPVQRRRSMVHRLQAG